VRFNSFFGLVLMVYQWDEPFVISDRRLRERFPQQPTDVDEAAVATMVGAWQHYTTTSASPSAAGKNVAGA